MGTAVNGERRALTFNDLAQVMPEVFGLAAGHRVVGAWTLGQMCRHLAQSFIGSMDGLDLSRHRFKRLFFRRRMLRTALTKGIPPGYTVDARLTPPAQVDTGEAVVALACAVRRYQDHDGALCEHPLFGNLSRDLWDQVHRVHCAHHLSFALPLAWKEHGQHCGTGLGHLLNGGDDA